MREFKFEGLLIEVKFERKKEQKLILKVNIKKLDLQVKVECQIDEQNQDSKIDLQTLNLHVKVKLVKDVSTSKF
jgi:hypothetical protein